MPQVNISRSNPAPVTSTPGQGGGGAKVRGTPSFKNNSNAGPSQLSGNPNSTRMQQQGKSSMPPRSSLPNSSAQITHDFKGGQGDAVANAAGKESKQNLKDASGGAQELMNQMAAANILNMKMQAETATMKMMTDMANAVAKTIKSTGSSVKDLAG
jgi:hypothetical protein